MHNEIDNTDFIIIDSDDEEDKEDKEDEISDGE